MKFEHTDVWGLTHALRGMRNPMNSWHRSDTYHGDPYPGIHIGPSDLSLAQKLIRAGTPHDKFMRQIMVSVDITAPLYWWKEFDTYKVGTVANSTSTMHKLASTPITADCFEMGDYEAVVEADSGFDMTVEWGGTLHTLEYLRLRYNATKDERYWKELIRLLPESWLQKRTVTMSYANVRAIVHQRRWHRLTEWHRFIGWARTLINADELIFLDYGKEA